MIKIGYPCLKIDGFTFKVVMCPLSNGMMIDILGHFNYGVGGGGWGGG